MWPLIIVLSRDTFFGCARLPPADDPRLVLQLGVSQKVALVREFERAQLDCALAANPPATQFGWTFNGQPLLESGGLRGPEG